MNEMPEGWRKRFADAVYENLAAADNQDIPLEEYPTRILAVLDSIAVLPGTRNQEDAERYRLLRRGQHWSVIDGAGNTLRADALDVVIDAVRAKKVADLSPLPVDNAVENEGTDPQQQKPTRNSDGPIKERP